MKIIDLLNRIANGEDVPKKIKVGNIIWSFDEKEITYFMNNTDIQLFYIEKITKRLNDEVEILEEEKEIPKKLDIKLNSDDENKVNYYRATNLECDLAFKINEIIDYLKSKGE